MRAHILSDFRQMLADAGETFSVGGHSANGIPGEVIEDHTGFNVQQGDPYAMPIQFAKEDITPVPKLGEYISDADGNKLCVKGRELRPGHPLVTLFVTIPS